MFRTRVSIHQFYGFNDDARFSTSFATNNLHAIDKNHREVRIVVVEDRYTCKSILEMTNVPIIHAGCRCELLTWNNSLQLQSVILKVRTTFP